MTSPAINKKQPVSALEAVTKNGRQSWFTERGIPDGEWFHGIKPQIRALIRPTFTLKARVYALGLLHATGFQDEMAWKQIRTRDGLQRVPYTSKDIVADVNEATERFFQEAGVELPEDARERGLVDRTHVRRVLAWLESGGMAERQLKDGTRLRDLPIEMRKQLAGTELHLLFFLRPKAASEKQAKHLLELWQGERVPCSQDSKKLTTCGSLKSIRFATKVYNKLGLDYLLEELAAHPEVVNIDYLAQQLKVVVEDYQKAHSVVDEDYRKRFEVVHTSAHIEKNIEEKVTIESRGEETAKPEGDPKQKPEAAPPPRPSSAIALPEPEREQAFDMWRQIMDGCGKPVSVHMSAAARARFFKYGLPVQQRIVEDAFIRAEQIWNEPRWTPDPLEYLDSRVWDLKPVKRRTLPSAATSHQQQKNAAFERLRARAQARDREREGRL